MRHLSASDLLGIWDRGTGCPPVGQALIMLGAAFPRASVVNLANLTIGQRDICLFKLREMVFGSRFHGLAACPCCGEKLEMEFDVNDLCPPGNHLPDPESLDVINAELAFSLPPYDGVFRLPTSADLEALTDASAARDHFLKGCIVSLSRNGERITTEDLPAEVQDAIIAQMEQADPMANIGALLACPACGHQWQIIFDIVTFFWGEINAWAYRILRELHILASAYGWSEADILALNPRRRQFYLEMAVS